MAKPKKLFGAQAFEAFFLSVYKERWPAIRKGLLQNDFKVARRNAFFPDGEDLQRFFRDSQFGVGASIENSGVQNCFQVNESFDLDQFTSTLLPFYRMDPASILAAQALGVEEGDIVLDMCAAPGGKTLVLLEALAGTGQMVANELSPKRRFRLMSVIKRYIPPEIRKTIDIQGRDGVRFGLSPRRFDKILLDAPCSGERGVLHKQSDLALWKEKRTKSFAMKQYALLSSAFLCLKSGGRILYSTCSISPYENDGVIEKLHRRHGGKFKIGSLNFDKGRATEQGWQFLPDEGGWGPIYMSLVEKQ